MSGRVSWEGSVGFKEPRTSPLSSCVSCTETSDSCCQLHRGVSDTRRGRNKTGQRNPPGGEFHRGVTSCSTPANTKDKDWEMAQSFIPVWSGRHAGRPHACPRPHALRAGGARQEQARAAGPASSNPQGPSPGA